MSNLLIDLTQKGWALPVLGALEKGAIARTHPLAKQLQTSPISIRTAIAHLIMLGLLKENPGHGHPLRPEYLRTPLGEKLGPLTLEVIRYGEQQDVLPLLRRRWTLPIIDALEEARSFSDLRRGIIHVTDRALSLSLKDLARANLVRRKVLVEHCPPATLYLPTPQSQKLRRPLDGFTR